SIVRLAKPDRSGVRAETSALGITSAPEAVLDVRIEIGAGRRRIAKCLEDGGGHVIIEIFSGLAERDAQDAGVVIVVDAIDRRGSVETMCAHIVWSARRR